MQFRGEQLALLEGLEDGRAPGGQGFELFHPVTDGGDGDFIEGAGHLLAVAGDEGDGSALLEQEGRGRDLAEAGFHFLGNGSEKLLVQNRLHEVSLLTGRVGLRGCRTGTRYAGTGTGC